MLAPSLASVSISVTNVLAVETSERMVHRRCHSAAILTGAATASRSPPRTASALSAAAATRRSSTARRRPTSTCGPGLPAGAMRRRTHPPTGRRATTEYIRPRPKSNYDVYLLTSPHPRHSDVVDELLHGNHEVRPALDDGLLHRRRVGHGRVVHAEALHRRVELVEELLADQC